MTEKENDRRERGAVAVEFALLLPVLVVLVFGVIDFGLLFNAQITLSQAARESSRLAALNDPLSDNCTRTLAATGSLAKTCGASGGGSDIQIVTCASGTTQTSDGSTVITYKFAFSSPLSAFISPPTITLTGKGYMPCQG